MAPASRQKPHVLWATDGSASARNAVPLLRGLVLPAAERLTVLTVAPHSLISGARPDPAFIARVTPAARRGAPVRGGRAPPAAGRLPVPPVAPPSPPPGARPDPAFIARVTPAARRGALVEAE